MTTPRKPGRPATGKSPRITVSLTVEERAEIAAAARADRRSVSSFVLLASLEKARKIAGL